MSVGVTSPLLQRHSLSSTLFPFVSTLLHALREERHFALVEKIAIPTKGSLVISFRSGSRSDPCISSVHNLDHDYYFELLREEEWNAQSIVRCSTAHHGDVRAVPRANRISNLLVILSVAHHPKQTNREFPGHGDLGDLSPAPHHQVDVLTAPFWNRTGCHLRRFHSQEAQHRIALLGDMSQPSSFSARLLQRHQSEIAPDLLPALKSLCLPNDQHEGQGGERTHPGMRHQAPRLGTFLHFLLDGLAELGDRRVQSI